MDMDIQHNVHGTFVSEKINKIRWRPDFMNNCHFFLTGSWDNDENHLKLWDFQVNDEDDEVEPFLVAERNFQGDVTEAKFLNSDYFVTSSSYGSVHLMRIESELSVNPKITPKIYWKDIHKFPNGERSPCTGVALYDSDIASFGEDGRIHLLNSQNVEIVKTIDNADSCSILSGIFLKHNEILTGNMRGQMKIFDLRSPNSQSETTFMLSDEQIAATCLQSHPTQRHVVLAGDNDGTLTVWDLRENTYPVNVLNAHDNTVSEIQFHPDNPEQLFSCSISGDVFHWATKTSPMSVPTLESDASVWLSSDTAQTKLEVSTLMQKLHKPINSLDVNQNKVIVGCDNEAIYLINEINLFV